MATKSITAAGNTALTQSGSGTVSTMVVHLTSSSFSGSIVVQGRLAGTQNTFVAIPYKKRYLNGSVADDSVVSTAITGTSVIEVNCAGLDVNLSTTYTSGSMDVQYIVVDG